MHISVFFFVLQVAHTKHSERTYNVSGWKPPKGTCFIWPRSSEFLNFYTMKVYEHLYMYVQFLWSYCIALYYMMYCVVVHIIHTSVSFFPLQVDDATLSTLKPVRDSTSAEFHVHRSPLLSMAMTQPSLDEKWMGSLEGAYLSGEARLQLILLAGTPALCGV